MHSASAARLDRARSRARRTLVRGIHLTWIAAASPLLLTPACDGDEGNTSVIDPTFPDPCRYFPSDGCSGKGVCHGDDQGQPMCLCEVGYHGASCATCEPGFHLDSRGLCITDRGCEGQPANPCRPHGSCENQAGVLTCACEQEYGGPRCTLCAAGYARGDNGRCEPDLRGTQRRRDAGSLAQASADTGVARPDPGAGASDSGENHSGGDAGQAQGEAGAADAGCPSGRTQRATTLISFEDLASWPALDNQCNARTELVLPELTLRSRVGAASPYVWACARNTSYPQAMSTRHVELEASSEQSAQIKFPRAAASLRFEYEARASALSLDVLVGSATVQTIELAHHGRGTLSLALAAPTSDVTLRSRNAYRQTIAIDNLEYQSEQCQ